MNGVIVVGYKPWIVRCIGGALVSMVLVVVGQHEALTLDRAASSIPVVTVPNQEPAFSAIRFADVRIPNPTRAPSGPLPPNTVPTTAGSAAVAPGGDGDDRWSVLLRPPLS